jgi:TolB-like protein
MSEDSANQSSSGSDVFVSYASQDASVANAVVENLEQQGIKCWIAPRDVRPGTEYADAIVAAINESKAVVLILSASAVGSSHVGREIERAASKHKRIIAYRMDSAPLSRSLEYFLSNSQWIDVQALGRQAALGKLAETVSQAPAAPPPQALPAKGGSGSAMKRAVVGAVIVVALAFRYWPSKHGTAPAVAPISDKSIAVLPFADMSQKKDQEYFGDGMAEEILDLLAKIPGLTVIGRTSSFQFKGKNEDLRKIGTELNAAYVLEGSVRSSGDQVRITAQLINTRTGAHEWSETYDRPIGDVLKLQDAIAAAVVRELQLTVVSGSLKPLDSEKRGGLRSHTARTSRSRSLGQGRRRGGGRAVSASTRPRSDIPRCGC